MPRRAADRDMGKAGAVPLRPRGHGKQRGGHGGSGPGKPSHAANSEVDRAGGGKVSTGTPPR